MVNLEGFHKFLYPLYMIWLMAKVNLKSDGCRTMIESTMWNTKVCFGIGCFGIATWYFLVAVFLEALWRKLATS